MSMLTNERIIASACCKHVLYLTIIKTREDNTSFAKFLLQTTQWGDIKLASDSKAFGVLDDILEVSNGGRGFFEYISAFKYGFESLECLGVRIAEVEALEVINAGC